MDLRHLFRHAETVEWLKAGTVVFAEGVPGEVMYVVLEGEVEIRVAGEVVETVGAGGVVGEMALVDRHLRNATAVARTACRLVLVDEYHFLFMVQEAPFFSLHLMRIITDRLRHENLRHVRKAVGSIRA